MKKFLIINFLIVFIVISIFYILKMSNKKDYIIITAIPIHDITEKIHNNDLFYLTVDLEDYIIEEYNLSYDKLTLRVSESIYNKVVVNSGFIGVSLRITIPYNQPKSDIETILREKNADYCEIIGITAKGNFSIG